MTSTQEFPLFTSPPLQSLALPLLRLFWLACLVTAALPAGAIVIRHDRDDAAYRELAKPYSMVCRVGAGQGTLIDPHWVLTAAHVADALPRPEATVTCGGRAVPVAAVRLHPDYAVEGRHRDLALVQLAEPVTETAMAHLYEGSDEEGRRVTFVGDGHTATGLTGVPEPRPGAPRVLRAAHNRVAAVRPGWLDFTFDAPPNGEALEGISGPGDSGGPALIALAGVHYVIGVSAANTGEPHCAYGTTEHYSRVSDELPWIRAVMAGKIEEDGPRLMRFSQGPEGRTTVERLEPTRVPLPAGADAALLGTLEGLVAAIHSEDKAAFLALFSAGYLDQHRAEFDSSGSMWNFLTEVRAKRGNIVRFHPLPEKGLTTEDSPFPMRPVVFHLKDGAPGYFGLALDDEGKIDFFSLFVMPNLCSHGAACTLGGSLEELRNTAADLALIDD
jgi:hypothetical protein